MPKDDRLYGKFVLDFPDHPKIMPLSDAAFRCLIEATLWSRKQLTNGLLSKRYALARWGLEVLTELSTNDPVKPSLIECEEGWRIHDFAEHQTTTEELDALREVRSRAGRRGGIASAEAKRKQLLKQAASKINPETETETETTTGYVGRETHVSSGHEPNFGSGISATRGADVVRANVPKGHPSATMTALRLQASELLNTGTDPDTVAAALRLWSEKPSIGIGRTILASLCSEVIKNRTAPTMPNGQRPSKARIYAEMAAQERQREEQRAQLTAATGKAITA